MKWGHNYILDKDLLCFLNSWFIFSRQGFVPAESVMNLRKQLGCDTFQTEEKGTRP